MNAEDGEMMVRLDTLPESKQQPNLLFALFTTEVRVAFRSLR